MTKYKHIIGDVLFDTDRDQASAAERVNLEDICKMVLSAVKRQRMELIFIGHTDHRAGDAYNEQLAKRRAEYVKHFFDNRLGHEAFYSSWKAISRGEKEATQGRKVSADRMARDRRVDIFSTLPLPVEVDFSPVEIGEIVVSLVPRITHREWSNRSCTNTFQNGQAPDPGRDAWKELVGAMFKWLEGGSIALKWGGENKEKRRSKAYPADFTVNKVVIKQSAGYSVNNFDECNFQNMEATYFWGPPTQQVTIETSYSAKVMGNQVKKEKRTKLVDRKKAMSNPLFFPPAPNK